MHTAVQPSWPAPQPPVTAPASEMASQPVQFGRRARAARWGLAALALGLAAGGLAINREGLVAVIALFVLVVPFEKLFPRHRQRLRRPLVGTDIAFAVAGPLLSGVGIAAAVVVGVVSLAWLPGLALRPLVALIPGPALPIVGIALFDLAIYWTHRWYHEVPVLWRFHAVHHSTEHLDWISGFRSHPLDGTLIAPAFAFLLAAGFSPEFTGALAAVQIVLGIFLHANVRWRLRWLHKLVITPEFHHWHHANEPGAVNSNYAVFLPAWDLIFGTYFMPKQRRPQVYGIDEEMPSAMASQLWYPFRGIGNPLRIIRHPIASVGGGIRFVRMLVGDLRRSTRRPRRRSHDDVAPGLDQPMATARLGPGKRCTTAPPAPAVVLSSVLVEPPARSLAEVMGWDPTLAWPPPDPGDLRS